MTDQDADDRPLDLASRLAELTGERSGLDTFARYFWQTKQAVRLWLTCLSSESPPSHVVCEHVEDIVLAFPDKIRFLQLKTRDRGSWSAAQMCDTGLDTLMRTFNEARKAGLSKYSSFELWLEGPIADAPDTVSFVKSPMSASAAIRTKLIKSGGNNLWLNEFLQRLEIRPGQPPRAHIDATAFLEIGALWPRLSMPEIIVIYERLLSAADAAQRAEPSPAALRRHLADRMRGTRARENEGDESEQRSPALEELALQMLDRETLLASTPPLPGEPFERLFERLSAGSTVSPLELKLRIGGVSDESLEQTQRLRAEMEVERQLLLASRDTAEDDLDALAERVLTVARATARNLALSDVANPAAAARPAEAIASLLLSEPHRLAGIDRRKLFDADGLLVYGFLAHLSDLCRYPWRDE